MTWEESTLKIFLKADNELNRIADKYKKNREFIEVSVPISFNGTTYREIIFEQLYLIKRKERNIKGVIFISEQKEIVSDKAIIRDLTKIFLNLENLLEDSFLGNLEKTIVSDSDIKEEEKRYKNITKILQILIEKNTPGVEKVEGILKKLPQLKKENNILIKQYIDLAKPLKTAQDMNSEYLLNDIKQIYNLTLLKNFEKIKLISTGKNYYDFVKKEAIGLFKKKLVGTMGSNKSSEAANVEYVFNHLLQVVDVYNRIIDMSENDYIKYLNNIEKQEIIESIQKNRAIQ